MKEYNCEICAFNTTRRTDYYIHLNSNKHFDKIYNSNRVCYYCKNIYATDATYRRHIKDVHHTDKEKIKKGKLKKKKDKDIINDKIKSKKDKRIYTNDENYIINRELFNEYRKLVEQQAKQNELLTNELKEKNEQIRVMNTVTMTAINYAKMFYTNAKQLEYKEIKLLNGSKDDDNDYKLEKQIINYHKDKILDKHLGELIIKQYKTDKEEEQSLWNTDISRLTFIIRECIKKGKKPEIDWITDKKGLKITDKIIKPLTNHVKDIIVKYQFSFTDYRNIDNAKLCMEYLAASKELTHDIETGKLGKDILKYVASNMHLERK